MSRLPAALFIVDILKENIAVAEARKLNIPTFAMVDTNSDPTLVNFPIPANDDASKSIALIIKAATQSIAEGLAERKMAREKKAAENEAKEKKAADKKAADKKAAEQKAAEQKEKDATDVATAEEKPDKKKPRPRKTIAKKA